MASAHIVCGPVGAGKTTYGRRLATELRGVFFCLDEWMATLFMMDAPVPITLEWALPRTERCERQILTVAREMVALNVDVVLELGLFTRAQRERVRRLIGETGSTLRTHVLDVPREVRRDRVRARNRGSATYTVEVDDATFDWAESYYEPLEADELRDAVIVRS